MNTINYEQISNYIISSIASTIYAECYETKNWRDLKIQLKKELILDDKTLVLTIVNQLKKNSELNSIIQILEFCSESIKKDHDVIVSALEQHGWNLKYLNDTQRDSKNIVSIATHKNGGPIQFASDRLKNDRDFILNIAKSSGFVLEHVNDNLQDDKELVLIECQNSGNLITYASPRLKDDKEVALVAITKTANAINSISKTLRQEIGHNDPITYLKKAIICEKLHHKLLLNCLSKNNLYNTKNMKI